MTENYDGAVSLNKVRSLLQEGLTKNKIMELTGLSDRQVRNLTRKIHEQDKIIWKDQANESLENRALIIKKKYQHLADVCEKIVDDETKSPRDRIEAGKTSIACENNIYNMIKEGPLRFNNVVVKELEDKVKKNENN